MPKPDPRLHWKTSPETYAECYLREQFPVDLETAYRNRAAEMRISVSGVESREFACAATENIAVNLQGVGLTVLGPLTDHFRAEDHRFDPTSHYLVVTLKRRRR
jgi:hypothetical protein